MAEQVEALRASLAISSREISTQVAERPAAPRMIHDESSGIHAAAASLTIGITLAEPRSILNESSAEVVRRAAKTRRARG